MKSKYGIMFFVMMVMMAMVIISCEKPVDVKEAEKSNKIFEEVNREIGLPNIVNFMQKKTLKMIYELADQSNLICYAYVKDELNGQFHFIGKCVGFGIPFSAQYTNPEKVVRYKGRIRSLPQADPNGLFMPTSSSATWLLLINPDTGEPCVVYAEPNLVVSSFPLKINIANMDEQTQIVGNIK